MKIIVLGAGKVGSNIAKNLSVQSYDICVVDKAVSKLKKLQSEYDLAIVSGHASHPDVLKKAGIDSDTILISVTNDDEVNIVACQIAKQIFDVKKTICSHTIFHQIFVVLASENEAKIQYCSVFFR